jgi:hypothetical protein
MGAWGTALFSDDLAADVRGDFRDCIGDGVTVDAATEKLAAEYLGEMDDDDDEVSVFWLALAVTQWQLGRVHEPTRLRALQIIESGRELERWDVPSERKKREKVLLEIAAQLNSAAPPEKKVPKRHREANTWNIGEVLALQLLSGAWTLIRVIGHFEDKGGRFAVIEVLEWMGTEIPSQKEIDQLDYRRANPPHQHLSQFFFVEPRKKKDQARLRRLGFKSPPKQKKGGYSGLPWTHLDNLLNEFFDLG